MSTKPLHSKSLTSFLFVACLAPQLPAATLWTSPGGLTGGNRTNAVNSAHHAAYTQLVNATNRSPGGSGYSNSPPRSAETPAYSFVDFFDGTEFIRFDNVAITTTPGDYLAVMMRADQAQIQDFSVELWSAGSGYAGAPLLSIDLDRFRRTSWGDTGNTGNPNFNAGWVAYPALEGLSGNYDIQIRSASTAGTGSHLAGIGLFSTPNLLDPTPNGAGTIIREKDFSFANSNKLIGAPGGNPPMNALDGDWMDNVLTGSNNWIDFEVYNPDSSLPYIFSTRYRHGQAQTNTGVLSWIGLDGDLSPLATTALAQTGWQSNFIDSPYSDRFFLDQGYNTLRFYTQGITHFDYLTLVATPEPSRALLLSLAALPLLARRKTKRRSHYIED